MSEISPNTTISHYLIISKLGSGGMGEVYLAQDTKLDRKVALKILPSAIAANQDRMRRFVQEAKCAAALNHPNIAHIYEIGQAENRGSNQTIEEDSVHFIAMEFIDGHTLREEIHHERTPLSKLLKYLNQVTDGLAKAHAAGIIHRDLKPDNIMISRDGHAKILDFGLAKLVEATDWRLDPKEVDSQVATVAMPQRTSPGAIMGVLVYARRGWNRTCQSMPCCLDVSFSVATTSRYIFPWSMLVAKRELEELKRLRKTEYISAVSLAYICAGLGERNEALSWLEKGLEERAFQMQLLQVDPRLESLRDDPRFKELVRKVGLPS